MYAVVTSDERDPRDSHSWLWKAYVAVSKAISSAPCTMTVCTVPCLVSRVGTHGKSQALVGRCSAKRRSVSGVPTAAYQTRSHAPSLTCPPTTGQTISRLNSPASALLLSSTPILPAKPRSTLPFNCRNGNCGRLQKTRGITAGLNHRNT